jgi:Rab-like protein 2
VFDATRKVTYNNLKNWYNEMRKHCPHIPVIIIANKIDLDERVTTKNWKYVESLKVPFNFVSAADGTNVVSIFKDALDLAIQYKKNPPKDDFMADVLDLIGNDAFDPLPKKEDEDEEF